MASSPITSWQIDGETMETVTDVIFLGSKTTIDGDCSHEIKRYLLLGRKAMTNLDSILSRDINHLCTKVCEIKRCFLFERKAMTNLDSILKSRDITLPTEGHVVRTASPVVMYGCESWTTKKAEH